MFAVKPPYFFRFFNSGSLICRMPSDEKAIYLTFDDGPVPEVTPDVLTILREKNARATFFCVGDNVRSFQGLFKNILDDGHTAGNHTFNHLNGWITPPGSYYSNIKKCRELVPSKLFRPPYGRFTPGQYFLLKKEYKFIMWSVLTGDFDSGTTPEKCLDNALKNSGNGSIVVFHDSIKAKEKVLYALPRFIDQFSGLGYTFRSL
jgi:peptidoglycan/xylan/chitin deacetylase (PgdA/CDA1 family)